MKERREMFLRTKGVVGCSDYSFSSGLGIGCVATQLFSNDLCRVMFRYRLDHMSSAGMGEFNPDLGTDSVHLGVSRAFRAPARNGKTL